MLNKKILYLVFIFILSINISQSSFTFEDKYDYYPGRINFNTSDMLKQYIPAVNENNYDDLLSFQDSYIVEFKTPSIIDEKYLSKDDKKTVSIMDEESSLDKLQEEHNNAITDLSNRLGENIKLSPENEIFRLPFFDPIYSLFSKITGMVVNDNVQTTLNIENEYFLSFNGISLNNIDDNQLLKIKSSPYVKAVYPNMKVKINLMDSVSLINASDVWKYDSSLNSCISSGKECLTGKGIKVAIIDTGIDYTNLDFGGCLGNGCRVQGGFDLVNNDSDPYDDHGHGTHVAGIIASNGTLKGVAPEATLYSYKVLASSGSGSWSDIIKSIELVVDPNQDGDTSDKLDVASLSLGVSCLFNGGGIHQNCGPDDIVARAVDKAVDAGVVFVIAAGNDGPTASTLGTPGMSRKAITVAASYKLNYNNLSFGFDDDINPRVDQIAYFSSRGPVIWEDANGTIQYIQKPDISAPGVNICSTRANVINGSWASPYLCYDSNHIELSGTSMATPHVSGVVALMKQAHPNLSPKDIKNIIINTADPNYNNSINEIGGYGRINALSAVSVSNITLWAKLNYLGKSQGNIFITGQIPSNLNIQNIILEYASTNDLKNWTNISISYLDVTAGNLNIPFNTYNIPDGNYIIRLRVLNSTKFADDFQIIELDNYQISGVEKYEVYNNKEILPIILKISAINNNYPDFINYTLEYTISKNKTFVKNWTNLNIFVCSNSRNLEGIDYLTAPAEICNRYDSINQKILLWNVSSINESGMYHLRLKVNYNSKSFEENLDYLYIDPALKEGWPIHIDYPNNSNWIGFVNPLVYDLDSDGTKEIIVKIGRNCWSGSCNEPYSTIRVYHSNGSMYWEKDIGRGYYSYSYSTLNMPLIGDVDGDSKPEIIAYVPVVNSTVYISEEYYYNRSSGLIYALDETGNIEPGWPVYVENDYAPTLNVYDMDNDGIDEIMFRPVGNLFPSPYEGINISIIKNASIVSNWILPLNSTPQVFFIPTSSVGDLNGDRKTDFVYTAANRSLSREFFEVRDINGSLIKSFPLWNYSVYESVFPITADINGDGNDEIVSRYIDYSNTNWKAIIEVFLANGSRMPGFNSYILNESEAVLSQISSADFNNDRKKEIVFSVFDYRDYGLYTYVLHSNGSVMNGWPRGLPYIEAGWSGLRYTDPVIADVDGDNKLDVVVTSGTAFPIIYDQYYDLPLMNLSSENGGLWAWHMNGSLISGFPHGTQFSADVSPVIADIDGDDKAEIIASSYYDSFSFDNSILADLSLKKRASLYVWETNAYVPPVHNQWLSLRKDSGMSACSSCLRHELGETTNIEGVSDIFNGFTLDVPNIGKINFSDNVNLSRIKKNNYLLKDVQIKKNKIFINVSNLPELNKSAKLTFSNVNFVEPIVLIDGSVCSSDICKNYTYSNNKIEFYVDYQSIFEIVEGYVPLINSNKKSGGSSGGGGGGAEIQEELNISNNSTNTTVDNLELDIPINNTPEITLNEREKLNLVSSGIIMILLLIFGILFLIIILIIIYRISHNLSNNKNIENLDETKYIESLINEGNIQIGLGDIDKATEIYENAKRIIEEKNINNSGILMEILELYNRIMNKKV